MTASRLAAAYILDLFFGDPEWFPHPVRLFGLLCSAGSRACRAGTRPGARDLVTGTLLTLSVISLAYVSGRPQNAAWQIPLAWTTLATRCLLDEARAVIRALETGNLPLARRRLARIVGRETAQLDEVEIARAVIETLAESTCDGIVAPLFWLATGGIPFALAYKAVNTLDSMIGHPEPPYRYFGRAAARLDDAANLIPARLTALGIVAAAKLHGLDAQRSLAVWRRDAHLHASPNAGQSEAAMAGALGVQLGGTNFYDGRPHDAPVLGGGGQVPGIREARIALSLVATVSGLAFGAALLFLRWKRR